MKRVMDFVSALLLIVLLSGLMVLTALFVRWKLGSPVLYKQTRIGRYGKPFVIYKFRTMLPETMDGRVLSNEERMTKAGNWIRSLSLDELPQLVNVVKGEMSLVGPRPLLPQYLPFYTEEEARRHDVRPGITGLAQVVGRNYVPWKERFRLDVDYVDRQSLLLDGWILWRTAWKVMEKSEIEAYPGESMLDFDQERQGEEVVRR